MQKRPGRIDWIFIGLIGLAFAMRVGGLTCQSLWRDEVDALIFATRPLSQVAANFLKPGENGPLFFLALRPWVMLAGPSEFALRFPSAMAGTLAVAVTVVLVRRLAGRRTGITAGLLMATGPYLVWYGQEAKMYAVLTLLAPASLWLTLQAARRGRWWRWVLLYVVSSLGFYTHVLATLVVPVQALWLLLAPSPSSVRRRVLYGAGYLVALALPYVPLVRWQARLWASPTFETGHPFVPLPDMLKVLAVAFSRGILPVKDAATLLPYMTAWVAGIVLWIGVAAGRDREAGMVGRRAVVLLLIWLFVPVLAVYGISLGMPIFADRYLIWTLPAFLGLAAAGSAALARANRPLGLATLGAIIALNLVSVGAQAARPIKSDFRSAAAYVLGRLQPGDLLVYQIPYIRSTFTYYSSGRGAPDDMTLPWLDGPYTNAGMSEADAAAWMARGTADAPAAWLIASETAMWDRRGLAENWLSQHGTITDQAGFARVEVTRYKLK